VDVLLIGESRDPETLRGMLESAEIGVAAYSTVHTRSVAATPTRIINVFDQKERPTMAASLLASLRVIVQQRLFPSTDGRRQAVREFLVFDQDMRDELQELPTSQLETAIEGMVQAKGQPLERALYQEIEKGRISKEYLTAILAEKSKNVQTALQSKNPPSFFIGKGNWYRKKEDLFAIPPELDEEITIPEPTLKLI
jgi:defect-in-organelle-trafficking protein DotB